MRGLPGLPLPCGHVGDTYVFFLQTPHFYIGSCGFWVSIGLSSWIFKHVLGENRPQRNGHFSAPGVSVVPHTPQLFFVAPAPRNVLAPCTTLPW